MTAFKSRDIYNYAWYCKARMSVELYQQSYPAIKV